MKRLLGVLVLVSTFLFIVGYVTAHWPSGKTCTVLAAGVAHADEDCLHQDAISSGWAAAQQQQLTMAGATITTGLLYPDSNGEAPTMLTSEESGDAFTLAWQYLQPVSIIRGQPLGSRQAAGHVEPKAAALMRHAAETYGVLVINNPAGPCPYVSGIGCELAMQLILPKGSKIVVWWPGGQHKTFEGMA